MSERPDHVPAQQQKWPGSDADLGPPADHGAESWTARDRLRGRRAVITGGDFGIGRAVAIALARQGADVVIAHLPEEEQDAEATADLIGDELADFPPEQLERTFATKVFSPFWLVQALAPHLGSGESVIITTSVQAYSPSDNLLDHAATKAALNNLVVNLAQQLGPQGIRVNAVAPGPIWTPLIPATMPPEKVAGFGSDTPLGRPGQPVEVAAAYVLLASDEASYVSGTVLGVTGGKPVF